MMHERADVAPRAFRLAAPPSDNDSVGSCSTAPCLALPQDDQLKSAVAASGGRNWKLIAQSAFGNKKSDVQCLHRSVGNQHSAGVFRIFIFFFIRLSLHSFHSPTFSLCTASC